MKAIFLKAVILDLQRGARPYQERPVRNAATRVRTWVVQSQDDYIVCLGVGDFGETSK